MIKELLASWKKVRKQKLPIRLSHADRTGMFIFTNVGTETKTLLIAWLNKELPTGSRDIHAEDIDWMIPVLEFGDAETMELTGKSLIEVAEKWKVTE